MKPRWIKIESSLDLPAYKQGHLWRLRLKDGSKWWSALSGRVSPPSPVVGYYSQPKLIR